MCEHLPLWLSDLMPSSSSWLFHSTFRHPNKQVNNLKELLFIFEVSKYVANLFSPIFDIFSDLFITVNWVFKRLEQEGATYGPRATSGPRGPIFVAFFADENSWPPLVLSIEKIFHCNIYDITFNYYFKMIILS
jgi:hypothetical protein